MQPTQPLNALQLLPLQASQAGSPQQFVAWSRPSRDEFDLDKPHEPCEEEPCEHIIDIHEPENANDQVEQDREMEQPLHGFNQNNICSRWTSGQVTLEVKLEMDEMEQGLLRIEDNEHWENGLGEYIVDNLEKGQLYNKLN